MAEDNQEAAADDTQDTPQEDPIKNLKAEFSRKQANLEAQQAETNAQLQAILAEVQKSMKGPEVPKKSARELVYDDPEEFVRTVKEEAVREASEVVNRQTQASQAVQNEVNRLQQKYPEFSQEGSDAVMLAMKKAQSLPSYLKGKPEGVRLAMQEAAEELGLIAASRRKTAQQEEPVATRGGGNSSSGQRKTSKIDERTLQLADLLNFDLKDPKAMAELEKASARKNYSKYE